MPSLEKYESHELVKLLALGDAKSGKTGSLVSLVQAGYSLRILNFDDLLDILANKINELCPEKLNSVHFITLKDPVRATATGVGLRGKPSAWINAIKLLDHWKDGDVDLGVPAEWGGDCILVVDSLSRLCDAAYDFHEAIIPRGKGGDYDGRAVYGNAQDDVERLIGMLTSKSFGTNVIIICHGTYMDLPDGTTKIFPQGVGKKLSPKIPTYFPNYVRYINRNGNRTISLKSDALIDLSSTKPIAESLPIETGLATIFETLTGGPVSKPAPKPALRRAI
jgi:AAA domain